MKIRLYYFHIILGVPFLFSCTPLPEYPIAPQIEFENVSFKDVANEALPDALTFSIRFQDGDGDLGLDDRFTAAPFNNGIFPRDDQGNYITIKYLDCAGFDFLPPYKLPYRCINWIAFPSPEGEVSEDTLYFEPNPNFNNMEVIFLIRGEERDPFREFDG